MNGFRKAIDKKYGAIGSYYDIPLALFITSQCFIKSEVYYKEITLQHRQRYKTKSDFNLK